MVKKIIIENKTKEYSLAEISELANRIYQLNVGSRATRQDIDDIIKLRQLSIEAMTNHEKIRDAKKNLTSVYAKCREAYIDGYESGHNDTVESCHGSADEKANEWISEHFA